MRKPPEEYNTWTEVLEEIEKDYNRAWYLKRYKTLYYVARFGNSGCIPIETIRVKTLYKYVEAEKNGYVHPKKKIIKQRELEENEAPF